MKDFKDFYSEKTRIKRLPLSDDTKLIVMSDMHRGDGSGSDDFAHNSLIYKCALDYYLGNGFTYIELGDAEEMGTEVRCPMSDVGGRRVKTDVGGRRSVAPGEAWSVGIGGDRAVLEIRYRSLMGSNPIR